MTLDLDSPARPDLSVVMVTYGGWDWPRRCLEALRDHTHVPFEVVVVDNASPDETPARLREEVRGARLVFNQRNVGFAPAVNQGALEARGQHLCILNPDALVRAGWLPPLLEALGDPTVGAAMPMYLNPDGTVQEAGSVIDRQGWTHAVGAGAEADDPAYRFRRDVDYGSAACLVMRRETFHRVGGLDAAYLPAYVEDVDLAFSLRDLGLRVVYEPRSRVLHGGTVSSDVTSRTGMIEANRAIFLSRWAEALSDRAPLEEFDRLPHRLVALRDALAPIRLLALADVVEPDTLPGVLLADLARRWPEVRVTVAVTEVVHPEPLLAAGVEVVEAPDEAWFEGRRLHATALLLWGPGAVDRFGPAAMRTQPQALRLYAMAPEPAARARSGGSDTSRRRIEVEAARGADALLCTAAGAATAEAVAPSIPVLSLGGADSPEALMAFLGAAPSETPLRV